jgi:hypothetical protein
MTVPALQNLLKRRSRSVSCAWKQPKFVSFTGTLRKAAFLRLCFKASMVYELTNIEHWSNDDIGKTEVFEENPVPIAHFSPQIPRRFKFTSYRAFHNVLRDYKHL